MKKDNVVQTKSFQFALEIIRVYRVMRKQREYVLARQLLRAGTSIGANVEEATAAQSRREFVAKLSIVSKEARETRYWLRLLQESQIVEYDFRPHLSNCQELINILTSIIKTVQTGKSAQAGSSNS